MFYENFHDVLKVFMVIGSIAVLVIACTSF